VAFEGASVQAHSHGLLIQAAVTMKAHREVKKWQIEGHVDAQAGGKAADEKLSLERAEAVRAFLIRHGVPRERVVAAGAGSSKPVAGNDTARGREANRRIEVHVLEREQSKGAEPAQDASPDEAPDTQDQPATPSE
jgi:outer membrane protein OmpA-like peptidoglycan-associated protein